MRRELTQTEQRLIEREFALVEQALLNALSSIPVRMEGYWSALRAWEAAVRPSKPDPVELVESIAARQGQALRLPPDWETELREYLSAFPREEWVRFTLHWVVGHYGRQLEEVVL